MRKGTTSSLGKKQAEDKFYTKPEIVDKVLSILSTRLNIEDYDTIIEPSAGNGSFSKILKKMHNNVFAFDLKPEHESIVEADWLTLDKAIFEAGKNLIMGNPPFGIKGDLIIEFFSASSFADHIAFILPKGFKKESTKNRIPLNFHLIIEEDLPLNSFTLEGDDYNVPSVFQVWEKRKELRIIQKKKLVSDFVSFVSKDDADFMLVRVGGRAGKASLEKNGSPATNLFLRNTSNLTTDELIEVINLLEYPSKNDTTGPRSVPKSEFIAELEKELLKNQD